MVGTKQTKISNGTFTDDETCQPQSNDANDVHLNIGLNLISLSILLVYTATHIDRQLVKKDVGLSAQHRSLYVTD